MVKSIHQEKKIASAILIDLTTDEDFNFKFVVDSHDQFNDFLRYNVANYGIPLTNIEFKEEVSLLFAADSSYKYDAATPAINYRIILQAYEDELQIDSGQIIVNKQRNTAKVTINATENPTEITFANEGNSDGQEMTWEIRTKEGDFITSGTDSSVPQSVIDQLTEEGDYIVTLTTTGYSRFGNPVQEKVNTGTFAIVFGDLTEIHTIIDADGNETEYAYKPSRGKVGTKYTTKPMDIPGYKLVEKPKNATGEYTKDDITVEYFYKIIEPNLTVKYVDENGKELHKPITSKGVYDENYDTDEKAFDGYELVAIPSNASGTFGEDDIVVTYVYRLIEDETNPGEEVEPGEGGNEGSETGTNPSNPSDPLNPGTSGSKNPNSSGQNKASLSQENLSVIFLPQTGTKNILVTGFVGGA